MPEKLLTIAFSPVEGAIAYGLYRDATAHGAMARIYNLDAKPASLTLDMLLALRDIPVKPLPSGKLEPWMMAPQVWSRVKKMQRRMAAGWVLPHWLWAEQQRNTVARRKRRAGQNRG